MVLLKKGTFEFTKILEDGYEADVDRRKILSSTIKNNSLKVVYSSVLETTIKVSFGGLNGETIKTYQEQFTNGEYQFYDPNTRTLKTGVFIVTKPSLVLNKALGGEYYKGYDIIMNRVYER